MASGCKDYHLKKKRVHKDYHLTSINVTQTWYDEGRFVLATQAQLVMYINKPTISKEWNAVENIN